MDKVKVEAGQIWRSNKNNKKVVITRVSYLIAYQMIDDIEVIFGNLDIGNYATHSWADWSLESSVPIQSEGCTGEAINDFTCPTCNNERCSKMEKKCWKCGNNLHRVG